MHVAVRQSENRTTMTLYDRDMFKVEAEKGLLKVVADVRLKGATYRGSMTATCAEDVLTIHTVKATVDLKPRSAGAGTCRYEVKVDNTCYLLETYFGANYQCLVIWETDSNGKTVRVGGVSYDPVERSLIVRDDLTLFVEVMEKLLN